MPEIAEEGSVKNPKEPKQSQTALIFDEFSVLVVYRGLVSKAS